MYKHFFLDCLVMVLLRSRCQKKVFKYGTPEPSVPGNAKAGTVGREVALRHRLLGCPIPGLLLGNIICAVGATSNQSLRPEETNTFSQNARTQMPVLSASS